MKAKKVPVRMCAGCGGRFDKRDLVRVVRTPQGDVQLDLTGKMAGRGAYVCHDPACLQKARKKRAFERALEVTISDAVYDRMEAELKDEYRQVAFYVGACPPCRQAGYGARPGFAERTRRQGAAGADGAECVAPAGPRV